MSSPTPTSELVRRAQAGQASATDELCARYAPRVRGLVAVRMGRPLRAMVDCDDVVQETMLTAMQRLPQFTGPTDGSFICWLARIVGSRVQDALRADRAQKRGGGHVRRRADLGVTTLANLAGRAPSPSSTLAARELDPALERALLELGAPAREIVYCRLVLDMSHAEVAAELGLANEDSARAQFHRALAKLRERMQPPGEG